MAKEIITPWDNSKNTRQVEGRKSEVRQAKKYGARLHPNSGAGNIKDDASNSDTIFEFKDVAKTHQLTGASLDGLFRRAVRQGKEAQYIVLFQDVGLEAVISLRRSK